jgi:hypothetical protein
MRSYIQVRDQGCDLGIVDFPIYSRPTVHHLNPITEEQIHNRDRELLDPENLGLFSPDTHNAIHYSDESQLPREFVERYEGDTKDW